MSFRCSCFSFMLFHFVLSVCGTCIPYSGKQFCSVDRTHTISGRCECSRTHRRRIDGWVLWKKQRTIFLRARQLQIIVFLHLYFVLVRREEIVRFTIASAFARTAFVKKHCMLKVTKVILKIFVPVPKLTFVKMLEHVFVDVVSFFCRLQLIP